MPLTDLAVKGAKAQDKPYKIADERGMYLLITKAGKYWRLDYRIDGKRKTLALGVYPDITLSNARANRDDARRQIANGIDPNLTRKAKRMAMARRAADSLEAITREWHLKYKNSWTRGHADRILRRLELNVFPWLGKEPIGDILASDLLPVLRRIELRGHVETAHRTLQNCGQVFRYAVSTGRADRDPTRDLRGALTPVNGTHHAAITDPKLVAQLLRDIAAYEGRPVARAALRLAPLLFVRPVELRKAEWEEIDFDTAEWRIPASRMKMRTPHFVPLSTQAVGILMVLKETTGNSRFVFPSVRTNSRPMSENTINAALRAMGYGKEQMTGHGFRSTASTLLNEQGWHPDAIERQLAHCDRNGVRAAYNYAEHLPIRRRMMQAWSDYLDRLKAGEMYPVIRRSDY